MNENLNDGTGPQPVENPAPVASNASLDSLDFPEEVAATPQPRIKTPRIQSVQNVEVSSPTTTEYTTKRPFNPELETLDLPSDFLENVAQTVEDAPNVQLDGHEQGARWAEVLRNGMSMMPLEGWGRATLENPDALWVQKIDAPSGALQATTPSINMPGAEVVQGERGIITMLNYLGMGSVFRVPLWNSGFWMAIKAPSEGDLLELHREGIADKIRLGRESYGMAFSNNSSYTAERLVKLALANIHSTNLQLGDRDWLDVLSIHDLYNIVWAMACAIWNNGFQYRRACSHDPEKCQHFVEAKINVTKLQWINRRAFTPHQIAHMAQVNPNSVTYESVLRYRQELLCSQPRQVIINEGEDDEIRIQLRVPSIGQHIRAGHEWVSSIASMVNGALGEESNLTTRNNYIVTRGKATSMRQFLHWVESVTVREKTMKDEASLQKLFDRLSADDHVRTQFLQAVNKYSQDTATTVIGIPDYQCPVCKNGQNPEHLPATGTHILPLDVYQTFFTLTVQRIGRIGDRY